MAGKNFGGGHGHYVSVAFSVLSFARVGGIIAASIPLTVVQKGVNAGIPTLVLPDVVAMVTTGDDLAIDLATGVAQNRTTGGIAKATVPDVIVSILAAGGIERYALRKLAPSTRT